MSHFDTLKTEEQRSESILLEGIGMNEKAATVALPNGELLSVVSRKQFREIFGISRTTEWRWICAKKIPYCKVGRKIFYTGQQIANFAAKTSHSLDGDADTEQREEN